MPALAKPTFATSLTLNLYAASMALPFVLLVLSHRSEGLWLIMLLLDFVAFCTLLTTSIILCAKTWASGRGWVYPVGAVAAVVLFFLSVVSIGYALDYLSFKRRQDRLELQVYEPGGGHPDQLAAAGIIRVEMAQPGVKLFVEGGAAGTGYGGIAYSASGERPDNGYLSEEVYYWHHITGPWYRWSRSD